VRISSGQQEDDVDLTFLLPPDKQTTSSSHKGSTAAADPSSDPTAGTAGGLGGGAMKKDPEKGKDEAWPAPGASCFLRRFMVDGKERRVKVEVVSSVLKPSVKTLLEALGALVWFIYIFIFLNRHPLVG